MVGPRIRKGESHVRDGSRSSDANGRYGHARDVLLEANRNLYAICRRDRILLRGLLHL